MPWIVIFHAVIFLLFWMTNLGFKDEVNSFLATTTGLRIDFLVVFLIMTSLIGAWALSRLISQKGKQARPGGWPFQVAAGLFVVFFYITFIVLFIKNPIQVQRIGQMIQYFRIFFDIFLFSFVAWGFVILFRRADTQWKRLVMILFLIVLWVVPLILPPGATLRSGMPEKPRIMAHRGASTLAPENTLTAMKMAVDLGAYGLESDVTISQDGVLFLMHDATLARTTNVEIIFPGRENDLADGFFWDELSQLDTGSWFTGFQAYEEETIPKFQELLKIVKRDGMRLIFDLRISSPDHPYAGQTLELCLAEIKAAGVASQTWLLTQPEEIARVKYIIPDIVLARGIDYMHPPKAEDLVLEGYDVVNAEYGLPVQIINSYIRSGLWVNIWTVDETWQFSRLWLAGVNSVTSNNLDVLVGLQHPIMVIPYGVYLVIWTAVGSIALIIISCKVKHNQIDAR